MVDHARAAESTPVPSERGFAGLHGGLRSHLQPDLVMELKGGIHQALIFTTSSPSQGTNESQKFGMPNTDVSTQISGLATIDIVPCGHVGSDFTLGDDRLCSDLRHQ